MGSSWSKAAKTAAGAAQRQYPRRILPNPTSSPADALPVGTSAHPKPYANSISDETISRDAADPDFARSLRSLGPVQPSPTFSSSSVFNAFQQPTGGPNQPQMFPSPATNPALQILDSRNRLSSAAEAEFAQMGRSGFEGKEFLDVVLIRQALSLRDEKGLANVEIEKRLGLKSGVVARLGATGTVGDASMGAALGD